MACLPLAQIYYTKLTSATASIHSHGCFGSRTYFEKENDDDERQSCVTRSQKVSGEAKITHPDHIR